MKYWFIDFLEECTENLSKVWVEHKKKKNANYKEPVNLKNRIRFTIKVILVIALILAIISFGVQVIQAIKSDIK